MDAIPAASQNQTPAPFRTGVVLVPLDVRVVDRKGQPVTDLTSTDFTILEDGVTQQISHFSIRSLTNVGPHTDVGVPKPLAAASLSHRTFVIVLDRGNLNARAKALDALIDFVRTKLLLDDRVGVIAYLRASELTTDHPAVVRFLERYRERHERIERGLSNFEPSINVHFNTTFGKDVRSMIDALFDQPGLPRFQDLAGGAGMNRQAYHGRVLVPAIEYLRQVEGEKHLILVSEKPLRMFLGSFKPNDDYYVRQATGARVALHLIHTGGVATPAQQLSRNGEWLYTVYADTPEILAPSDLRLLAEHTGGTSAYYQQADKPLAHLDRITRFQYLLGYYPTTVSADDHHRVIQVRVNRPGVTALYRHGYQVRPQPGSLEDFRRAFTETRIANVASWLQGPPRSIAPWLPKSPIKVSAAVRSNDAADSRIDLDVSFDAWGFTFVQEGGLYTAGVDLVVFVDDANDKLLGEKRERLDLKLNLAEYARIKREWLALNVTTSVSGRPAYARAIVYQYETNRLLSAKVQVHR